MEGVAFSIDTKDAKFFKGTMDSFNASPRAKAEPFKEEALNVWKSIGPEIGSGIERRMQQHMDSAYQAERSRADSLQSIIDNTPNNK